MAVTATGFFDGVHLGHRQVVNTLVSAAESRGEESVVITFDRHPREVLGLDSDGLKILSTLEQRVSMLRGLGVDRVEVLDFTPQFAAMTAREYIKDILVGRYGSTLIVMGYDNRLGCDGKGPEEVALMAGELGVGILVVPPFSCDAGDGEVIVSSTVIRDIMSGHRQGDADALLGYEYFELDSGRGVK